MLLPNDSIGPTDILSWRDCPRRMSFGMRRHTALGEHPEAVTEHTAYGSAVHDMLSYVEEHDAGDDEAVQHAFDRWGHWLEPGDLTRLHEDLATYRRRDFLGVRVVANEGEYRVPLMEWQGRTIYFRFRLDRLYQTLSDPSVFIHKDYKSSRWQRTEDEIHSDVQLWAYNWGIHEVFTECTNLLQIYDQLRYGAIPTRKSDAQREMIHEWLVRQATAILNDEDRGADGLLQPKKNQWCAYCPIMESCPIVTEYTDFALSEIAALAPERKEGRKTVVDLDPSRFEEYVSKLDDVANGRKVLERFEGAVRSALLRMPNTRREDFGYVTRERRVDVYTAEALSLAHEVLGDAFYEAIGMSKKAIERIPDPATREFLLGLSEKQVGTTYVQRTKMKT